MITRRALACYVFSVALCVAAVAVLAAEEPPASKEAVAAYQKALTEWEAGKQQAAEASFTRAASLAPDWGAPNARLGVIYQLQGKEAEARAQYAITQTASLGPARGLSEAAAELRNQIIAQEAHLVFLVNQARLQQKLPVLVPDATVGRVARKHSEEMRDKGYFAHESPTRGLTNCQDRFLAIFGYRPRLIAENLSRRWGRGMYCFTEPKVYDSHVDLLNSPGHRRNILYPSVEWLGVGIAVNDSGDYWITEVFVESGR